MTTLWQPAPRNCPTTARKFGLSKKNGVIPGVGRGTIRLAPAALIVETTPVETFVPLSTRITTLEQLAAVVEERFGSEVALVGKAVTLADMIASEFLVVFHETASGYTSLTQAMNAHMAKNGVPLALNPIVRLSYPTWDTLAAVRSLDRASPVSPGNGL